MNRMQASNGWRDLAPRERGLLLLAAALAVGAAGFEWGIDPLLKGRAALSKELPALRAQAVELTQRSEQLEALEKTRAGQRRGLSETALREHLAAASLNPTSLRLDQGAADIHFAQADAAAVLRWASRAPDVFGAQVTALQVAWSGPVASVRLRLAP